MAYRKWTPSKTAKREFAQKMNEIDDFCREHGIHQSARSDSYYFTINGKSYRVSNHSVEASNARAFTDLGEQIREKYHPDGREEDVIYIHASKTRIKEIYNNLVAGYELDGRGNIKTNQNEETKLTIESEKIKMKKLEDFSIRERRAVENLIATHEELLNTPSDKRITYYFGDYGMHFLKDRITDKEFRPAYEAALKDLGQTPQEFEANTKKYALRWHVIEDLQTKMIENKTPNIDKVGVFNVTINDEEVYKSYSYNDAQKVATREALNADNYGKKIKVVTAFAATNANLNSVEFEAGKKYELTDIRQSVSISGESLYRIKALKEFVNEATGVVIEKGQLGGFVQSEKNLSQDGTCWIDDNARVFNNAKVTENAYVGDESMISLNAEVTDNAVVKESAWITQNAKITDKAFVTGTVMVKGNAVIKDEAIVCGNQSINGNTEISTGIHDGTAAPAQITMQSQSLEM